jgi:hypothetical protein
LPGLPVARTGHTTGSAAAGTFFATVPGVTQCLGRVSRRRRFTHRGGPLAVDGVPCDQSVHGNDFWQTDRDAESGTWSRTVTLPLPEGADHVIRFEAAAP